MWIVASTNGDASTATVLIGAASEGTGRRDVSGEARIEACRPQVFRRAASEDGDDDRATVECAAPPWAELKSIFVHDDIIVYLGGAGARVVAGMVDRLDVMDADGSHHVIYAPPLKGRPAALGDGRTVAIEGDGAIALVDVVDETYALVTGMAKKMVKPLAGRAKAFVALSADTASVVRYD